jgi:hypothetical protein
MSNESVPAELDHDGLHPADPVRRRQTLWALLIVLVIGALMLLAYRWAFLRLETQLALQQVDAAIRSARWLGVSVVAGLWLSTGTLAWISWRFARAVRRDERFPPSDARLIRATPVLRGAAALQRARLLQGIAVLLSFIALLGGALVLQVLWVL